MDAFSAVPAHHPADHTGWMTASSMYGPPVCRVRHPLFSSGTIVVLHPRARIAQDRSHDGSHYAGPPASSVTFPTRIHAQLLLSQRFP